MNVMAESLSLAGTDYLGTADYSETAELRKYLDSKNLIKFLYFVLDL